MSLLIDNVYWKYPLDFRYEGRRYMKRPSGDRPRITTRIIDAMCVLTGKKIAVHFKEDEI